MNGPNKRVLHYTRLERFSRDKQFEENKVLLICTQIQLAFTSVYEIKVGYISIIETTKKFLFKNFKKILNFFPPSGFQQLVFFKCRGGIFKMPYVNLTKILKLRVSLLELAKLKSRPYFSNNVPYPKKVIISCS